ncbi:murein transglycosylase A [Azonexus sp. R2A61]|uniref:murein transglycosylase A n=1 Tax=Azonexus sp. R2A61 TaxID=2744443 RepID=UPI001F22529E|nr:murein transglycosylase A [Azonexus sp. R2A61]
MSKRHAVALLSALLLSACGSLSPTREKTAEPAPSCPPCAACPVCPSPDKPKPPEFSRTLTEVDWAELPGWRDDDHAAAWPAFMQSCRGLRNRAGAEAWRPVCAAAAQVDGKSADAVRRFFESHLVPHRIASGDGAVDGMVTGYYEPLLQGSRTRSRQFAQPVLGVPGDLLTVDLGDLFPELKGKRVRGRVEGNKVVPYWSRGELLARGDKLPARTLAYVDDAIELFFLQVQGSGRIRLPDGSLMRVNYADQNGHPYRSIGRVLVDRGDLKLEEASMQGIQAWARANPARLDELLNSNPSYVFFRETPANDDGPQGALGVPLTAERSIAVDTRSVPLGAPVFLATTRPNSPQPLQRLVMAQDVGGAIRGAVRADFFWGFGKEAGALAGRMKQSGRMWVLLPRGYAPK